METAGQKSSKIWVCMAGFSVILVILENDVSFASRVEMS